MSYIPGNKSENPKVHFEAEMKDFARFDKVRLINISGLVQYGIIYSILYFIVGIILHIIFPPFEKGISLLKLFFWILLQCLVVILVTFYIQKFVEAIPGWASFFPQYFDFNKLLAHGFIPYGIDEFKGSMAANIILLGTQVNLLNKVAYFTKEFAKLISK
jgi:hypothetical protein